ncbi:hypothetical protein BH10PSE7_BH10PSE7_11800 [soil metagenome]
MGQGLRIAAYDPPPRPGRLSTFNIVVTAFAAVAGVVFAAIQTFSTSNSSLAPISVTLALDPQKSPGAGAEFGKNQGLLTEDAVNLPSKTDGIIPASLPAGALIPLELGPGTSFTSALKSGDEGKYLYRDLFDGRSETFLTIEGPENEINLLVGFPTQSPRIIGGIEYTPPRDAGGLPLASILDITVLPEGQLGAGQPIMSFALQTANGSQTFALPEGSAGKGLWLRIAGPQGVEKIAVGDFKILQRAPGGR